MESNPRDRVQHSYGVPGPISRKHKDWFDENCIEITQLLTEKRSAYKTHIEDPSSKPKDTWKNLRSNVQMKLRQMHASWLRTKADEIQGYADRHYMKNFYGCLKEMYGPTPSGS